MTRGMAKEGEQLNTDELHLREFWIHWDELMEGGAAPADPAVPTSTSGSQRSVR